MDKIREFNRDPIVLWVTAVGALYMTLFLWIDPSDLFIRVMTTAFLIASAGQLFFEGIIRYREGIYNESRRESKE